MRTALARTRCASATDAVDVALCETNPTVADLPSKRTCQLDEHTRHMTSSPCPPWHTLHGRMENYTMQAEPHA